MSSSQPAMAICNRCIPHLNNDLGANPCDGTFGVFAKKCSRCARQRHACVAVEPPLYPALLVVKQTRDAHARSVRRGDDDQEERADTARAAATTLTNKLRVLDRNRNKVTGDRPTPRKQRAAAPAAASNDALLMEVQSLRRGILGLVEVGRALLRAPLTGDELGEADAAINNALGVDAPAAAAASPASSSPAESMGDDDDDDDDEQEDDGDAGEQPMQE